MRHGWYTILWTHSAFSFHFSYKYYYSFSKCKYFHLLLAPIKGKGYNLYWFRIDNKHMTEPWLDQALMESAYKCGMRKTKLSGQIIEIQNIFFLKCSLPKVKSSDWKHMRFPSHVQFTWCEQKNVHI